MERCHRFLEFLLTVLIRDGPVEFHFQFMVQNRWNVISRKIAERVRLRRIGILKLILSIHVDNVLIDKILQ